MTDLTAIRERHASATDLPCSMTSHLAHQDRGMLLSLLDAADEELARLRPYAPTRCVACGYEVPVGATKPTASGGRMCVDRCVVGGCHSLDCPVTLAREAAAGEQKE